MEVLIRIRKFSFKLIIVNSIMLIFLVLWLTFISLTFNRNENTHIDLNITSVQGKYFACSIAFFIIFLILYSLNCVYSISLLKIIFYENIIHQNWYYIFVVISILFLGAFSITATLIMVAKDIKLLQEKDKEFQHIGK